jgi:hypothetical protein
MYSLSVDSYITQKTHTRQTSPQELEPLLLKPLDVTMKTAGDLVFNDASQPFIEAELLIAPCPGQQNGHSQDLNPASPS